MVPAVSDRISPVPPYSGVQPIDKPNVYGAFTLYGDVFQTSSTSFCQLFVGPTTPIRIRIGLGSSAFARHYLRNHYYFLLLQVLRCFSSLGYLHLSGYRSSTCKVSLFGHLRINARLQLPVAFRSLPRPSSSLRAKASPVRPCKLPSLCLYKYRPPYKAFSLNALLFNLPLTFSRPTCQ